MGVFIYKTKGDLGKENFTIEAIDILLMAKGSAAEVGYVPDIEMFEDLEALGIEEESRGLIHCHNRMGTSFSTTDTNQLILASQNLPYYLSVVVNNEFEFTAKIAIKNVIETKGFKWFKNLKGGLVRTPVEDYEEVYDIHTLDVVLEKPEYMRVIDERIAKKLQFYTSHTGGGMAGVGGNNNYTKKGSETPDPVIDKKDTNVKNTTKRTEDVDLFSKTASVIPYTTDADEYGDFIKAVLDKYCKPEGHYLGPDECAFNIVQDKDSTGIPVDAFLKYLEINNYSGIQHDKDIVVELGKLTKEIPL